MMDSTTIPANNMSFKDFLLKDKRNKTILILAGIAIVIQFAVFKYLYPYASYIHDDSFSYIKAADQNLDINTYLIGYSKFLRLFSVFFKSDFALVVFQYLLVQFSVLFLLFTFFYFYKPGKPIQIILLCFMIFNPLFLHLANLVSSDCFFLALSMLWISSLLWIIHRPSKRIILWHVAVLLLSFTVRHNAIIYPFLSAVAFGLSNFSVRQKIAGICASFLFCGLFVGFTSYQYKMLTGYWQYSPFSGWQLANNAMYAYRYVHSTSRKPVPKIFQALDKMITEHFDSTQDENKYPHEAAMASTYYMWSKGMPLMKFRESLFKTDSTATEFKKWASMGPLYKAYGTYIIKQYPRHFAQYFIWPNANKYYAPPVEFLESYNGGKENVRPAAKAWFGYKSSKVKTRMTDKNVWILNFYPILSGIVNVVMLCTLVCYFVLKGWKDNAVFNKGVFLGGIFWLLNACFTIVASSVALRFQSFPMMLTIIYVGFLLDWMVQLLRKMKHETENSITCSENFTAGLSKEVLPISIK